MTPSPYPPRGDEVRCRIIELGNKKRAYAFECSMILDTFDDDGERKLSDTRQDVQGIKAETFSRRGSISHDHFAGMVRVLL